VNMFQKSSVSFRNQRHEAIVAIDPNKYFENNLNFGPEAILSLVVL
jgi:hypothetical protein